MTAKVGAAFRTEKQAGRNHLGWGKEREGQREGQKDGGRERKTNQSGFCCLVQWALEIFHKDLHFRAWFWAEDCRKEK